MSMNTRSILSNTAYKKWQTKNRMLIEKGSFYYYENELSISLLGETVACSFSKLFTVRRYHKKETRSIMGSISIAIQYREDTSTSTEEIETAITPTTTSTTV